MARRPSGVAALPSPRILAAMLSSIEPIAGWSWGTSGKSHFSTGLSARQLERKFARNLGISPKTFARVVRFKSVVAAAGRPDPPDWVRLAGDFGYADQPHLVREFKIFSGLTPVDYRQAA